jgi:hypothetical protein
MVTNEFIDSLGIEKEKADALKTALKKDSFYRNILYKVGIMPGVIENIMRMTDTSTLEEDQADILAEKARVEWADFIPANKRK